MERTVLAYASFKADWKRLRKKHYSYDLLDEVVQLLIGGNVLPGKYKDHALSGKWKGCRECHIQPNWLLVYMITDTELTLVATGTHDDLFK